MAYTVEEFVAELGWEIDARGLKQFGKQIDGVKRGLKSVAKYGALATAALSFGLVKVMKAFSMVEDAKAAFQPIFGDIEKATELVGRLNDTAASTPFQFGTLSKAAKQLLPNMGKDVERTIETIRMLGDTAGGNAIKMDSIVRGYNKALLIGKVDMESLRMIAEAGVPVFEDLAKVMGTETGPKFFKMISSGAVKTEDLTQALKNMTSEGGMFFRGMEIASLTLTGRISTLKDLATLSAAEFGDALAPAIKDVVEEVISIAKETRAWVKANKAMLRSKGTEWIRGFVGHVRSAVRLMRRLNAYMQSIGGWSVTIKRIGAAFAVWKLGAIVLSLNAVLVSLSAMKGLSLAKLLGTTGLKTLVTGGVLALIPLLIEDIYTSLKGGKGLFYEEGVAIADATMALNGWIAELMGSDIDHFNLAMIQGINDIANGWGTADEAFGAFIDGVLEGLFQAIISVDNFGDAVIRKAKSIIDSAADMFSGIGVGIGAGIAANMGGSRVSPQSTQSSVVTNDNRSYRLSPSASVTQHGADMGKAQREIGRTLERQLNTAVRSLGG